MTGISVKNLENDIQYYIDVSPNDSFSMIAETNIKRGQCILTDPGLAVFPSGLDDSPESSALIKSRIDALPEKEREVFFTLVNHRQGKYDDYYGRYRAHASVIRHSPGFACIFPLISLVGHGCSPNCVTAVIPTSKTTGNGRRSKGWKLALRACNDIVEGEEICLFKLEGGGMYDERQDHHVERFGYPCSCAVCELPWDMFPASEENRDELNRLYNMAFERGKISPLRMIHYIGKMIQRCHDEDINDKSVLVLYRRLLEDCVEHDDLVRAHSFVAVILRINEALIGWECDEFHQGHARILLERLHEEFKQNPGIMLRLATLRSPELHAWLFRSQEIVKDADTGTRFNDFRDEEFFPTYPQLPDAKSEAYFTAYDKPKKHWFYIASPAQLDLKKSRLVAWDKKGNPSIIDLSKVLLRMENVRDCLQKCVVLIPYAAKSTLPDGTEVILATNFWIKILSGVSMFELMKLSCKVSIYSVVKESTRTCHGCNQQVDKASPTLSKCSRCSIFWYCSKDCQVNGWKHKGHKEDCAILDIKAVFDLYCMNLNEMSTAVCWELNIEFLRSDWNWKKLTSKASAPIADLFKHVQPIGTVSKSRTPFPKPVNPIVHQILQKIAATGPE